MLFSEGTISKFGSQKKKNIIHSQESWSSSKIIPDLMHRGILRNICSRDFFFLKSFYGEPPYSSDLYPVVNLFDVLSLAYWTAVLSIKVTSSDDIEMLLKT